MQYCQIPNSDLTVSKICLGTMTFGEQNTEVQAHQQMDYALSQGVNFFDTAEMYAVPPKPETQGLTEQYIGSWFEKTNKRQQVFLATKVASRGKMSQHIRPDMRLNKQHIDQAVFDSLKRLQTDYIDLYQTHWPERNTNFFGKLGYQYLSQEEYTTSIIETLEALNEHVKAGRIRYIGVSNETPWGVAEHLKCSQNHDLPRIVSVQNPYNLLNRSYEIGLAEFAKQENVGLLAYSPLAFGTLSGKYLKGSYSERSRLALYGNQYGRYTKPQAISATEKYVKLAEEYGFDPAQMALAYINQQPFVFANIIGATTLEQLQSNIESIHVHLPDELLEQIEHIHSQHPNPAP